MKVANLKKSAGVKRNIASILSAVVGVASSVPQAAPAIAVLQTVAGLFGITGIAHAGAARTLDKDKVAAITSFLAFVIALAPFIPALQPYVPYLQELAAILGAAATGLLVGSKSAKTN
jgi:hypothetical protein